MLYKFLLKKLCFLFVLVDSPKIINSDEDEFAADEGQTAILTCETVGHPEQNIIWYTEDGKEILTNNRTTVQTVTLGSGELNGTAKNSVLSISDIVPGDYGNYKCNASNEVGWSEHTITLSGRGMSKGVIKHLLQ